MTRPENDFAFTPPYYLLSLNPHNDLKKKTNRAGKKKAVKEETEKM